MIVRQVTPIPSNGFATTPIDLEIKQGMIARLGQKLENPQGLKEFLFKDALIPIENPLSAYLAILAVLKKVWIFQYLSTAK